MEELEAEIVDRHAETAYLKHARPHAVALISWCSGANHVKDRRIARVEFSEVSSQLSLSRPSSSRLL